MIWNKSITILLITLCSSYVGYTQNKEQMAHWWIGVIAQGDKMPMSNGKIDNLDNYGNQIQPLAISDQGEVLWTNSPQSYSIENGRLITNSHQSEQVGKSLRDAYLYAMNKYFAPQNKLPDTTLFKVPQYNTWIELMYNQNQKDILKYAHHIKDSGLTPGVIMIDDNWQKDYGSWDFDRNKFYDPKQMIEELHSLGFKVMLWICPFVSADSEEFRYLRGKNAFLTNKNNENISLVNWWNGYSALLDLTSKEAQTWFHSRLDFLQKEYGVDGFKFDAGDIRFYKESKSQDVNATPHDQCSLYAHIGLQYPLNEYRACWKMGNQPLVQRLMDKGHSWGDLKKLIPDMILEGLMGYPFSCPDMIGGGEINSFVHQENIDQELIVRSAQTSALMPMMQFSVAPWRVLSKENQQIVNECLKVREKYSSLIVSLAKESAATGEPILRSMEYEFPHQGYAEIKNQFMLGKKLLVAPILKKGSTTKTIVLPKGKWRTFDNKIVRGGREYTIDVNLHTIPYFEKIK